MAAFYSRQRSFLAGDLGFITGTVDLGRRFFGGLTGVCRIRKGSQIAYLEGGLLAVSWWMASIRLMYVVKGYTQAKKIHDCMHGSQVAY